MAEFFAELKRRQMFRVAAVYAVVAWLLLQVVNNLTPGLNLPNWVATSVIVVLALGFPVALIFAWIHQLAPADGATERAKASGLDWVLVGGLGIVILLIGYQQIAPSQPSGVEAARSASLNPRIGISLAVLPFANLSDDQSQAFFSDGITEEITTALARIPDLRVVARGSASQFKGQQRDMRAVGQALNATHLIEGSVRKAGTRLRISAQLVKADDGVNIWVNNYDRELTDVFAIQEEIATAIAGALRMPLGLNPGERLVASRTIMPEDYQEYLRAKPLVRALRLGVPRAIEVLEPVVARNPEYAPAWALLSDAYSLLPTYHRTGNVDELRRYVDEFLPKGEAAARRAIQLDPNLADGYFALARYEGRRGNYVLSEEAFLKGFALDPNNAPGLNNFSSLLAVLGRLKEALAMKQRALALEPYIAGFKTATAEVLWLNGQDDAAIALLEEIPFGGAKVDLAEIYASQSRYADAADILERIPSQDRTVPIDFTAGAVQLLRTAPAKSASAEILPVLPGTTAFIYLHVGAPNRVLDLREVSAKAGFFSSGGTENAFLWHPSYAPVRKTERFKAWVRGERMVDYWRAKGWPEFCKPVGADDFECS